MINPDFVTELTGRFHPVIVHLPIGILLMGCLFLLLTRNEKFKALQPATGILLFWGMLSAVVACITGYLLSGSGEYGAEAVSWHQWMGIGVAVVATAVYFLYKKKTAHAWNRLAAVLLLLLITVTGHLGGTLTHGSGYLFAAAGSASTDEYSSTVAKVIPDVQEAMVYDDIIQPIFQQYCYSCHGSTKQKGRLRIDKPDLLMQGGENGKVIVPGDAAKSELVKRLLLPPEDDDHMAPKEKPQLSEQQVALIQWWINEGASFSKKVEALQQPAAIQPALTALEKNQPQQKAAPAIIPETPVEKADETILDQLREKGVVILPVAQNSHYLVASFVTVPMVTSRDVAILVSLKDQLTWLDLANTDINDSALTALSECVFLTKLNLSNTRVTGNGLTRLQTLTHLQSLNLAGTQITSKDILQLQSLKNLRHLYLYQTGIGKAEWETLQRHFPSAEIDTGGYKTE